MKRKDKIAIVEGLENSFDNISIAMQALRDAKYSVEDLPHAQTLIGDALTVIKHELFNKGKKDVQAR